MIELPVKHPELFEALGIAQPKVGSRASVPGAMLLLYTCPSRVDWSLLPLVLLTQGPKGKRQLSHQMDLSISSRKDFDIYFFISNV